MRVASSHVTDYRFVKRLAEGIVGLESSHGKNLFTLSKLRKTNECVVCKVELKSGMQAYLPITHGYNRMHRICVACVHELEHLNTRR